MRKEFPLFVLSFALLSSLGAESAKELTTKTRSLEKVKSEINERQQEKIRLEKEASDLSQSLKESSSRVKNLESSLIYTKQKTVEIEQKLANTKNENDRVLAGVQVQRRNLANQVRAIQLASLMESPESPSVVAGRLIAQAQAEKLSHSLKKKEETGVDLRNLVDSQEIVRREFEKQQEKLMATKQTREDKERLLTKKKTRQEILETELKDLQRTADEFTSLIDVLRHQAKEEKEAEKEVRRQKQINGQSPIAAKSLPWPVHGKIFTRFGRQQHPTLGTIFISNGITITSQEVQPVLAVADGKVLYAGQFMSYGSMVVVEHPGDWYSVYGYLLKWDVDKGQIIKKGEQLGMMRSRVGGGYENYFELRFYGKSVDPTPWLN